MIAESQATANRKPYNFRFRPIGDSRKEEVRAIDQDNQGCKSGFLEAFLS